MDGGFISLFKKKEEPSNFGLAPIFKYEELKKATNNFSTEIGDGGYGRVYHGKLRDGREVAVKELFERNPDRLEQFLNEEAASAVGRVRHKWMANLIGCCAEGDERLLVAEFMPNDMLKKYLFNWNKQPLPWEMRLRVAYNIAQALDHCNNENRKIYYALDHYKVLFDEDGDPHLCSFGLMKNDSGRYNMYGARGKNLSFCPPEYLRTGEIIPETVIYCYGIVLLNLVTGWRFSPHGFKLLLDEKNALTKMDPALEGQYANEDATKLVDLAMKCVEDEARDRPTLKFIISSIAPLQTQKEVASRALMGL